MEGRWLYLIEAPTAVWPLKVLAYIGIKEAFLVPPTVAMHYVLPEVSP